MSEHRTASATHLAGAVDWLKLKCLTTVYRRVLLLERSCDEPVPDVTPRVAEPVAVGLLTPDATLAYQRFRPTQPVSELERRRARGDRCWVVWSGERIVHAGWVARGVGPAPYLGGQLRLGADDLFSYDSFTAPAWRGRGLAPARHAVLLAAARVEGRRRVACIVALENRAGRRALAKAGYRPVAAYRLVRLGPWRIRTQQTLGPEPAPDLGDVAGA